MTTPPMHMGTPPHLPPDINYSWFQFVTEHMDVTSVFLWTALLQLYKLCSKFWKESGTLHCARNMMKYNEIEPNNVR